MTPLTNSITRHIKPSDIANEARMRRGPAERRYGLRLTIVIVEGFADQLMYSTILDTNKCIIIHAYGKDNAIQAVQILLRGNIPGVLAIVDDDFDSLDGHSIQDDNVVITETHDLETLLFTSPALEKFLTVLLLPDKRQYITGFASDVRQKLIELGSPIGYIRWLSQRENMQLEFRNIYFGSFIDGKGLSIQVTAAIDEVIARNGGCRLTKSVIIERLSELMKHNTDPWLLCQGHDLVRILFIILPRLLYQYSPKEKNDAKTYLDQVREKIPSEERVTEQLIMCYERDFFKRTSVYSGIRNWENRNAVYGVLPE